MADKLLSSVTPPDSATSEAWWFVYSEHRLLVKTGADTTTVPLTKDPLEIGIQVRHPLYLGTFLGRPCYAAEGQPGGRDGADFGFLELRSLFGRLEDNVFEIALIAVHLVVWDKTYQFCTTCRGRLQPKHDVRAKACRNCGRLEFPRLSPAIIVLIEKGDTLLLARSPRFAGEFFSVLAGFVEPGESLEQAVRREVMEEVGIAVKDISYFGSQPWPFPDSLMIGFTAQYESGEIKIDDQEIVEAGWYRTDSLPRIPGKISIARKLIDWFIEKHQQ
jgi:NAD+ diphosphatase